MQTATLLTLSRSDYPALLAGTLVVAVLCYVAVLIGLQLNFASLDISLFDFATGFSVGILTVFGIKYWPGVIIGTVSGYIAGYGYDSLPIIIALTTSVCFVSLLAAILLQRYLHQHFELEYIPDLLKYFFIVVTSVALLGGTLISLLLLLLGSISADEIMFVWSNACIGKLTGVIVIAPFIMVWSQGANNKDQWPKFIELVVLITSLFLICGVVFFGWFDTNISGYSRYPLAFLLFPILVWAAFRFGQRVSTASSIIIAIFALWSLLNNLGPFSRDSIYESHFLTWLCINTASALALILAADITYCKKVRVALRQSDERLDLATSGSQDGLWDWPDMKSTEMWWSPIFYQLLDYRSDELSPSHSQLMNLMHPDDRERHRQALENHLAHGDPYNIDFRMQTKSQGYRWFHAKAQVNKDKRTGAQRMAGSIIDIDDRKIAQSEIVKLNKTLEKRVIERTNELEEKNNDLHKEIQQRNKAELEIVNLQNDLIRMGRITTMGEMASALAHELHQPLMAIINYSNSVLFDIENQKNINPEIVKNIENISEQALRGGEIIRNMKQFALRGKTNFEDYDVNELIIELKPLLNIEVVQNDIDLAIELEDKEMIASLNHIQIQQVISNLVKNSIEAMKYNVKEKQLIIRTLKLSSKRAVIEIVDNGAGINKSNLDNIFDSFYTTKSSGLGLGLSISQKIIEAHDGSLEIYNNNKGATARIQLKLSHA